MGSFVGRPNHSLTHNQKDQQIYTPHRTGWVPGPGALPGTPTISFFNCVIDGFLDAAFRVPFVRHDLFQRYHDEFVRRTDPIMRGSRAVPAVFAHMRLSLIHISEPT